MSTRTPELRAITAARITAAVASANVQQNGVDPATAARIVQDSGTALITVQFARIVRDEVSHDPVFRTTGDLDVIVYSLSVVALDAMIESVLAVVLTDIEWRSTFERVPAVVTEYEYLPAGDVDLAAARVRISCQWSEEYPGDLSSYGDLASVAVTTRPGHVRGAGGAVVTEVDPITADMEVGTDLVVESLDEIVEIESGHDVTSAFDPDGEIVVLPETPDEPDGEPYETPFLERLQ
jgi:hypothetical protein